MTEKTRMSEISPYVLRINFKTFYNKLLNYYLFYGGKYHG